MCCVYLCVVCRYFQAVIKAITTSTSNCKPIESCKYRLDIRAACCEIHTRRFAFLFTPVFCCLTLPFLFLDIALNPLYTALHTLALFVACTLHPSVSLLVCLCSAFLCLCSPFLFLAVSLLYQPYASDQFVCQARVSACVSSLDILPTYRILLTSCFRSLVSRLSFSSLSRSLSLSPTSSQATHTRTLPPASTAHPLLDCLHWLLISLAGVLCCSPKTIWSTCR